MDKYKVTITVKHEYEIQADTDDRAWEIGERWAARYPYMGEVTEARAQLIEEEKEPCQDS